MVIDKGCLYCTVRRPRVAWRASIVTDAMGTECSSANSPLRRDAEYIIYSLESVLNIQTESMFFENKYVVWVV